MKRILIISFIFYFFDCFSYSQTEFSRHYDLNFDSDVGWGIIKAKNNYFLLSADLCHQNSVLCSGLFCFDINWNLRWKIEIDSMPIAFFDCITTDDNHIYICAIADQNTGHEFILLKYDLNGNLVNSKQFGPYLDQRVPYSISYYKNLLYLNINCRHNPTNSGYDSTQIWYLDTDFNLIYSFSDTDKKKTDNLIGYLPSKDGNFIGFKSIEKMPQTSAGIVKKFDPDGKVIWASAIDGDSKSPQYYSLQKARPTMDNGCVGIWNQTSEVSSNDTFPEQPILFKLDSNGKLVWSHAFFSKRIKYLYSLFETHNGDIVGVGVDENPGKTSRYKSTGWVVRFSNDGKLLWEHSFIDTATLSGYSHFYNGIETDDENLVFCGSILPKRDSGSINQDDVWLVRIDKDGCLIPTCDSVQLTTKIIDINKFRDNSFNFTNPVHNDCYIYSNKFIDNVNIKITSINGNVIFKKQKVNLPINIDVSDFQNGIYIILFYSNIGNSFISSKLLKL